MNKAFYKVTYSINNKLLQTGFVWKQHQCVQFRYKCVKMTSCFFLNIE